MSEFDEVAELSERDEALRGKEPREEGGAPSKGSVGRSRSERSGPGRCPRWMYHRAGVFCGACQQVITEARMKKEGERVRITAGGDVTPDFK